MIVGTDLLPMSWIADKHGHAVRAISIVPGHVDPNYPPLKIEWYINSEPEEAWQGIPLTPQFMKGAGFRVSEGVRFFVVALPVTKQRGAPHLLIAKAVDALPYKSLAMYDGRPLDFVHELQLMYFAETRQHLIIDI